MEDHFHILENTTMKNEDSDSFDLQNSDKINQVPRLKRKLIVKRKRLGTPPKKSIFTSKSAGETIKKKAKATPSKIFISL